MKTMALVWIALMLSCFSTMAQENTTDDPFGTPKPSWKFTILLGPDFKTEERPFLDAFTLYGHLKQLNSVPNLQLKDISIDIETPLPTEPGPSLQFRIPELKPDQTIDEVRKEYFAKAALPFGITRVNVQVDKTLKEPVSTIRIGMLNLPSVDWNKYLTIADMLSSNPCIEIYDETPLLKPGMLGSMMGGMGGGMGGMGMSGSDLMGAMAGMAANQPTWAEPTGLMEGNGMLISWSLKNKVVAAIDAESSTGWQRIEIDSDAITSPVVGMDMCLFLTRSTAYGYSRKANAWSKHLIQWNGEQPPSISIGNQLARVTTDDDVLVFTSSGRWFTRNLSTDSEPLSAEDLFTMSNPVSMSSAGADDSMMGAAPTTSPPDMMAGMGPAHWERLERFILLPRQFRICKLPSTYCVPPRMGSPKNQMN